MKIGIYEGSIPPPIFINNLITGLANSGNNIYLYGKKHEKGFSYNLPSIIIRVIYDNKIFIILRFLYNIFCLILKNNYSSNVLLKDINKKTDGYKNFIKRCNRIIPIFLDDLDVFHIQWAKDLVFYPEFIKYLNCPVILSLRGAHINYSPLFDKKLSQKYKKYFPQVNMFHAVSKAISIEAQKYLAEKEKIKIIYPAIKNNLFQQFIFNKKFEDIKKLKIISVGRCHWKKGYTYALDTIKDLKDKNIAFHYTIIAAGNDYNKILYQIKELELENHVTFINGLNHKNVVKKLKEAHLLLLSSVEEGISNTVIEAMAIGTIVLTTDCGGMSEVVKNNENGFIVPSRDPNSMLNSILFIIKMNFKDKRRIIFNAKQTIEDKHLLFNQVDQMNKLYITAKKMKNNN